jgi:dipeptidyl aminopeptidase/acylaminoacyl peptidase
VHSLSAKDRDVLPNLSLGRMLVHSAGKFRVLMIRMRIIALLLLQILYWSTGIADTAAAQQSDPLSVEDALKVTVFAEFSGVAFSPDGTRLAYVTRDAQERLDPETSLRTGVNWNTVGAQVSVLNLRSGETSEITGGRGNNWLPSWSPDGRYLAFVSDRDGSEAAKPWVWDAKGNGLRKISDSSVRADRLEWTPDSRNLLITILPEGFSPNEYAQRVLAGREDSGPAKTPGSTVRLYRSEESSSANQTPPASDPWNLDEYLRDLVILDVATGSMRTIVCSRRIATYAISPDGTRVAYTVPKRFEKPGSQQILFDLAVVPVATGEQRVIASDIRLYFGGAAFSWAPDSRRLAFHTGGMDEKNFDCYVVGADGEDLRNLTSLSPQVSSSTSAPPLWDARGEHIYFINQGTVWQASANGAKAVEVARIPERKITNLVSEFDRLLWTPDAGESTVVLTHDDLGERDGFYAIHLPDGRTGALLEKNQCYTCAPQRQFVTPAADGTHLAYFSEDAQNPTDLWMTDAGFKSIRRLTRLNPQFEKYKMGAARSIDWLSDDGERLRGALLLPADYHEGMRCPLIVWVYGGVSLSDKVDHFGLAGSGPFNMQLLATRGYAVLLPDAPLRLGTPMLDLVKTVLPGVNKLLEMGIADPDRLGIMGHSNGGYSALALLVQTNRFKAAIVVAGSGNLLSEYGEMDKAGTAFASSILEHAQDALGGTPWEFRERYIENSPSSYLDRIETPLFIAHGAEDSTVAPFLGDEIFVGLRRLGKKVVYAKYKGEGHSPLYWSYPNQADLSNRMIEWFDLQVKTQHR